jgi:catechol-2,3-dioxygenase
MSPATPNNSPHTLSTSLTILHNELYVTQLEAMVSYYKDFVGMDVINLSDDRADMGNNGMILLSLIKNPQAAAANPRGA